MIDLKYLQNQFEEASIRLRKKGVSDKALEELKQRFESLKAANRAYEDARAEQNRLSKLFGQYKREGRDVSELQQKVNALKEEVNRYQEEARNAEEALMSLAMGIPNFPDASVPVGLDEEDNVEIRRVLEPRTFDFEPREHWELAEINGWIDFERGVKLAKSRFALLKGQGARLQTALINYFLEKNIAKGFEEYAKKLLYPYYREHGCQLSFEEFVAHSSLKDIEDYLKNSPKIGLMTNADDFILGPGDLDYLRRIFGDRARIYPHGGHCGNLDYKDNVRDMIDFFQQQ